MMNERQLKLFEDELKSYHISIKKTEAGKVVTCERLKIVLGSENKGRDTMPKRPRNPKKSRIK